MKSPIYSSRYFIGIGLFIFLCFIGIWFFMSGKLSKRTEQISIDLATKNYELKSNIIRNEFNGFIKGVDNVKAILPQFQSKEAFLKQQRIVEALLLNHQAINKAWYAIVDQKDTLYRAIQKNKDIYYNNPILKYQKDWIQNELITNDTITRASKLVSVADTLHWLVSSKHTFSDGKILLFGLDINLKELQRYLWGVDSTGRASASVIDEHGYYVINPVEKLIGTKMPLPVMLSPITRRLKDSISTYQIVLSPILEIPGVSLLHTVKHFIYEMDNDSGYCGFEC